MIGAPQVYIGDRLMDSYAHEDKPVIAGLSFNWGTDDLIEFEDAATCSASLLIRTPGDLEFLAVGQPFALRDPGSSSTIYAGRIATLKAKHRKNTLRIDLTAAAPLAELLQYRVERVEWNEFVPATTRRAQLSGVKPAGWALNEAHAGVNQQMWIDERPQFWESKAWVEILDLHLRATLSRRHDTSYYVPGTGLQSRLTITGERTKAAPVETLRTRITGAWYASPAAPTNSAFLQLTSSNVVRESLEWEKTPEDTITDVALTSWGRQIDPDTGQWGDTGSFELWVDAYDFVDNSAMQAKYGFHQIQFDVDMLGGTPGSGSPSIANIVNYWVDADTEWRPTNLEIPDSRRLPDADVLKLLRADQRYLAYMTVGGLPESSPVPGSRARAYVLAGSATWTGKKWTFELTLGRVPRAPSTGNYHTFDTIENSSDPAISGGTAETVGDELTFADFAYIGA